MKAITINENFGALAVITVAFASWNVYMEQGNTWRDTGEKNTNLNV